MKTLQITISVLLALSLSLPIRASEPLKTESEKSGKPLSGQSQNQKMADFIDYDALVAELDKILEETVSEALEEQYANLNAQFARESERLFESRSFWRKAAVTEGLVILGAVFVGGDGVQIELIKN